MMPVDPSPASEASEIIAAAKVALAGGMGGIVRAVRNRMPWMQACASAGVGAILAYYLAPVATHLLAGALPADAGSAEVAGFVIGLLGMHAADIVIERATGAKKD